MRTPLSRTICIAALAALPLAACGGDDDEGGSTSSSSPGGGEASAGDAVGVAAIDLGWEPADLEAPAGEIAFRLENEGSLQHTFVIEDHEDELELAVASTGDTDEGSITLEEGEYVFYCDVAGHRAGGMEGTLTVGPAE